MKKNKNNFKTGTEILDYSKVDDIKYLRGRLKQLIKKEKELNSLLVEILINPALQYKYSQADVNNLSFELENITYQKEVIVNRISEILKNKNQNQPGDEE